jgi:DNA-3-methyladenine glycosylase I
LDSRNRCSWVPEQDPQYLAYHDEEWGVPSHDDRHLFELLSLEGAQAGLSWSTILRKRDGYREAFASFDLEEVVRFDSRAVDRLLTDPGIVRNRRKIESVVANAKAAAAVGEEFESLDAYLWQFVGGRAKRNRWHGYEQIPSTTPESRTMSTDLKRRGFRFVGPTVCYAFMQAAGLVNDHVTSCFRYEEVSKLA